MQRVSNQPEARDEEMTGAREDSSPGERRVMCKIQIPEAPAN